MSVERVEGLLPLKAICFGSMINIGILIICGTILTFLTEFGWAGAANWPEQTMFLLIIFAGVILGSIIAGWKSKQHGWIVGLGVGVITTIFLFFLAIFSQISINYGVFLVKILICSFLGSFGGIIGVNLSTK